MVYLRECILVVGQIALVHEIQMLDARTADQILQTTDANFHAIAVALFERSTWTMTATPTRFPAE